MAGNSRSVEFDLLVSGTEVGARKLERLADKFDDVSDSVDRLDGKTARVRGVAKLEKNTDSLGDRVAAMGKKMLGATASVVRFTSYIGLAVGAAGPLVLAVGAATVAVAQFVAAVAPAATILLPLAAAAAFVQLTFKGMGEEFVKSVEPLTKKWAEQTAAAGKLATKGLRPIAREFVRINFPAIAAAQERIARSTNRVVTGFGKWLNTAAGVKVIKTLTGDTATTFERLAPAVRGVVQSVVALAGRVSGVAFQTFGDGAEYALDKLNGFIDGLGADDVYRAFDRIGDAALAVRDGFNAIVDGIQWLEANRQKILQFSDAVLALTAVGAALVGGWVVALGATLILLARHWDDVKGAVDNVQTAFANFGARFSTLQGVIDSFGGAWDDVKTGFREFVADVGPTLQPTLDRLKDAFVKMQPAIAGAVTILGALAKAFFEIAGPVVAGVIIGIGLVADAFAGIVLDATKAAGAMLSAFATIFQPIATLAKKLKLPFADAFQSFVDGSRNASNRINSSMAQVKTDLARNEIERLQRKVNSLKGKTVKTEADRAAIAASERRIRELQGQINGLRNKSVYISVTTTFKARGSPTSGFGGGGLLRAHGGPVQAGHPYIVGEQRPELFVPKQSGTIVPKVPAGWDGGGGGGGGTMIVNFSFPNYVGSRSELLREMRAAVKKAGGGNVQKALGRAS